MKYFIKLYLQDSNKKKCIDSGVTDSCNNLATT